MRRRRLFSPVAAAAAVLLPLLWEGCGSWQRVGSTRPSSTQQELSQLFDPVTLYTRLGRFVSATQVPFIGSAVFVPGHGDSTLAIVGLSFSNRVLAFERDGQGYGARYRVEYQFDRAGLPPVIVGRNETIRVAAFQETMRSDESILLQQQILLQPGDYQLTVRVRDLGKAAVGTATQKVVAPLFGPGSYTAPIMVYQVRARQSRDDSLSLVLNPRGTIAYGGDTLLVYLEGVGFRTPRDLPLQVRDEHDSLVFRTAAHFTGESPIESRIIRIAPEAAPLGQLEILVGPERETQPGVQPQLITGPNAIRSTSAVISFSNAWVVTNWDDLLSLLRYFGHESKLAPLRKAEGTDRASLWRDFARQTDPVAVTPENELLESYFARLAVANQRFRDEGIAGWRTDRGEVFITLGEPDEMIDGSGAVQGAGRVYRWSYNDYRLGLTFQDATGFGRFRLTPTSRSDFERIKSRVQAAQ